MQRPRVLHLVVLAGILIVAVVTVILLVWGRSGGAESGRPPAPGGASAATSTSTAAAQPPLLHDPKYRFVGEPLVSFHAPRPAERPTPAVGRRGSSAGRRANRARPTPT